LMYASALGVIWVKPVDTHTRERNNTASLVFKFFMATLQIVLE
jgi:hypothetical protein